MASTAIETDDPRRSPTPVWLLGFLILGGAAVLGLPEIAAELPHPGRTEQAQYATTCLGLLLLAGIYVYLVARSVGLDRAWVSWTLLYTAGLLIVKFILSPTSFQRTPGTSLQGFVTTGIVVMPLYLAALVLIRQIARHNSGSWRISSKLGVAGALAAAAVATRLVVAFVLGTAAEYTDDLLGVGLILPAVVAIAAYAVMESFDRAGVNLESAFRVGLALVVSTHLLWALYMYRLFS